MYRDWELKRREKLGRLIERYATIDKHRYINVLAKEFDLTRCQVRHIIRTKYLGRIYDNIETRVIILKSKV